MCGGNKVPLYAKDATAACWRAERHVYVESPQPGSSAARLGECRRRRRRMNLEASIHVDRTLLRTFGSEETRGTKSVSFGSLPRRSFSFQAVAKHHWESPSFTAKQGAFRKRFRATVKVVEEGRRVQRRGPCKMSPKDRPATLPASEHQYTSYIAYN